MWDIAFSASSVFICVRIRASFFPDVVLACPRASGFSLVPGEILGIFLTFSSSWTLPLSGSWQFFYSIPHCSEGTSNSGLGTIITSLLLVHFCVSGYVRGRLARAHLQEHTVLSHLRAALKGEPPLNKSCTARADQSGLSILLKTSGAHSKYPLSVVQRWYINATIVYNLPVCQNSVHDEATTPHHNMSLRRGK